MDHALDARRVAALPLALLVALAAAFALVLALSGCAAGGQEAAHAETTQESVQEQGEGASDGAAPSQAAGAPATTTDDPYATGIHHATIEVEGYGTIELALDANTAPITVANFCNLANAGFYDGITFHRIISGFMIQGGDPTGTGTGGSSERIVGEFAQNGIPNPIPHVRGTISMARAGDPDSASSQFFIVHKDSSFLDGSYAGFGHVTSGMEVVDAICEAVPVQDGNGTVAAADQPHIAKVTIVD